MNELTFGGSRKKSRRKKSRRKKSRRKKSRRRTSRRRTSRRRTSRRRKRKGGDVDNNKLKDLKIQAIIAAALKDSNDDKFSNDVVEFLQSLQTNKVIKEEEGLDDTELKLIGLSGGKNRKTRRRKRKKRSRKTRKKKGGTTFYKIKVFGVTYATKYKNVPSVIDRWIDLYDLDMLKKNKKVKVARLRQLPNKNNPEESQIPPKFELKPIPKKR